MTHHSRDQRKAAEFKREMHEALDDDSAQHIDELLAADQRQEHDRPTYQESAQLDERGQEGVAK